MEAQPAAAAAPVMPETPAPEIKPLTQEELVKQHNDAVLEQLRAANGRERFVRAKRRELATKDSKPTPLAFERFPDIGLDAEKEITLEQIEKIIELPCDKIRWAKDADGNPRIPTNRHGLITFPRPKGRLRPHMSKHQQAVKSAAIGLFKRLFNKRATELEAKAREAGEQFVGVPTDELPKIGARATLLATQQVRRQGKAARRTLRNRSKLSRKINQGVIPGNTNVRAYSVN